MAKKLSKTDAKEQIKEFFETIKEKTPGQIKKIKKLTSSMLKCLNVNMLK